MFGIKFRKWVVLQLFLFLIPTLLTAQEHPDTTVDGDGQLYFSQPAQNRLSLPFRLINNLIILPVQINGSDSLYFILDTGLKNSIICELSMGETLNLKFARDIQLRGLGSGESMDAIQTSKNIIEIGSLRGENQDFVVLTENVLQLSRKLGTRVHGILSMQAFQAFVIEINYDKKLITFYSPGTEPYYKKSTSLPMDLNQGKPYINLSITTMDGISYPVRLLLDTGASNSLWIDIETIPGFKLPGDSRECYLGCGISGDVEGHIGRVSEVHIGPFVLQDALVSYPDSQSITRNENLPYRNGSLGAEALRRFNLVFDFPQRKITFIPNRSYTMEFRYNMSGLEVMTPVPDQRKYMIARVRDESRAALAGVRAGDEIITINGVQVSAYNLDQVYKSMLGREGKKIRLILQRQHEKIRLNFRLEEYI